MRPLTGWVILLCALLFAADAPSFADERENFFETRIRPVLAGTCLRCHGGLKTSGALRVDSRDGLLKGGESGPIIVPGKPDESLLLKAIRRDDGVSAMPPEKDKALRADQIADFATWIKSGAIWPETSAKFVATSHWAFEPVRDSSPPAVKDTAWLKTSVDAFIRAKQEAANVQPAPTASKLALIRRVTFDLTGLPPTPEEVAAFERDHSPNAFETVVERLLNSRAYGERWARHWLDVVRYADTAGETADYPVPLAWRYRNYVIDAFQADKPYDEFLREQIAGDVLAQAEPPDRYAERVTATGYLAISRRFGFDSENYHHLTIQDTIDTLGQSVLGLSLGCCRCHDHKFDPVTMRDYYALYGIFDSSRYAFPGSEQKQKVRSMTPLLPPSVSQAKWNEYEQRVASLMQRLTKLKQPVPAVVLRSMNEIDGDFELQAPAAGGSNGVLVPPWLYEGKIAVTTAAQSPFKNLHPSGRVGASIAAGAGPYRIQQAIHPARVGTVFVNLDFRIGNGTSDARAAHRLTLGSLGGQPIAEMRISPAAISMRQNDQFEPVATIKPGEWLNLQLAIDLKARTVSGRVGSPGAISEIAERSLGNAASSAIELVTLDSVVPPEPDAKLPAIEFDNLGLQNTHIAAVSTELPTASETANQPNADVIQDRLRSLTGIDGDFELQTKDTPPAMPWNPGPNSVVKLQTTSQSPFRNLYGAGELGIHMPNRAEYDGFGLTIPNLKPSPDGRLFASFDFRCASDTAGGNGSWRYYLGHGPGPSPAIELFFNHKYFFRRSGNAREPVAPLVVGQWYQVQLTLDLKAKTYSGTLSSPASKSEFTGELASGWDGQIDYSFIDSYGHIGGVRPSLDADNFSLSDKPLTPFAGAVTPETSDSRAARRAEVFGLRKQLADLQGSAEQLKQELNDLLANGPFEMTYGMSEGTPHNVRMQKRGEPDQLGDEIPRGFIRTLGGNSLPSGTPGSGRRQLAEWLTSPANPLTARVMVNRIWQYHFGRGLVRTPNDFGVRGLPPTHPELLDHLASEFVRGGWSIKAMHRLILQSATYQQASEDVASNLRVTGGASPSETLYAAFPRRRLSAEEIRDAILFVSGELDTTPAREHPFPTPVSWGYTQHGPFNAVYDHNKRSVYLMTQRLKRHPFLALFDGPDPNATTADRLITTVPTQALFFLNDPFVHAKADRWATRLMSISDSGTRIELAFQQACGRRPTADERTESLEFLTRYQAELANAKQDRSDVRALAALLRTIIGSNEFLHVD